MGSLTNLLGGAGGGRRYMSEKEREHLLERGISFGRPVTAAPAPAPVTTATAPVTATPVPIPREKPPIPVVSPPIPRSKPLTEDQKKALNPKLIWLDREEEKAVNRRYRKKRRITIL